MQFTGLKDRNGVEIYEADVFQLENYDDRGDGQRDTALFYVAFKDGCWVLQREGELFDYLFDSHADGEVVANLYQNPELLN